MPNAGATANPSRIPARITSDVTGTATAFTGGRASPAGCRNSRRKNTRNTTYSTAMQTSHGPAISAAKPRNVSPEAWKASKFVRLDTGSSNEALLDRCAVA